MSLSDPQALPVLLASQRPQTWQPDFAIDSTTWPRCDCSPGRGRWPLLRIGADTCTASDGKLVAVVVALREITGANQEAVLALGVAPGQEQFVSSVRYAMREAAEHPQAKPWYRAVYVGDEPIGFVMLSWDVEPQPPEINGPWFLWKLLIDQRHQGRGYGLQVVRHIAELVHSHGATELLTSYVPGSDGPAGFYQRLGFVPTGKLDPEGEVIMRLSLPWTPAAGHPAT